MGSDAAFTILNVHDFMFYCAMLACELIVCTSSFRGFQILNKKNKSTVLDFWNFENKNFN